MRVLAPDNEGFVNSGGVRIHHEVTGTDGPTILLLPTWTIVHQRFWKAQVPYLSRHFRVVSYDGPGNGRSDRPLDPAAYDQASQVRHALAVLDATGTERAILVSLSQASTWALQLAAEHADRVLGAVFICPSLAITEGHPVRAAKGDPSDLPLSQVPRIEADPPEHWAKYDPTYWREHYEDFLWFFFGMCFPEPRSTKQVEDCVGWGLDTTPDVLTAEVAAARPSKQRLEEWARGVTSPVLVLHGSEDLISPPTRGRRIAELSGGDYVELQGSGHIPLARDPVRVNLLIRDFVLRLRSTTVT